MFSVFLEFIYTGCAYLLGLNVILPDAGSAFLPAVCFPQLSPYETLFSMDGVSPDF